MWATLSRTSNVKKKAKFGPQLRGKRKVIKKTVRSTQFQSYYSFSEVKKPYFKIIIDSQVVNSKYREVPKTLHSVSPVVTVVHTRSII